MDAHYANANNGSALELRKSYNNQMSSRCWSWAHSQYAELMSHTTCSKTLFLNASLQACLASLIFYEDDQGGGLVSNSTR